MKSYAIKHENGEYWLHPKWTEYSANLSLKMCGQTRAKLVQVYIREVPKKRKKK